MHDSYQPAETPLTRLGAPQTMSISRWTSARATLFRGLNRAVIYARVEKR
jgi:hypothetical protein